MHRRAQPPPLAALLASLAVFTGALLLLSALRAPAAALLRAAADVLDAPAARARPPAPLREVALGALGAPFALRAPPAPHVRVCPRVFALALTTASSAYPRAPLAARLGRRLFRAAPRRGHGHGSRGGGGDGDGGESLAWGPRRGAPPAVELLLVPLERLQEERGRVRRLLAAVREEADLAVVLVRPRLEGVLEGGNATGGRSLAFGEEWSKGLRRLEGDVRKMVTLHDELRVADVLQDTVYLPWNGCKVPV